MKLLLKNIIREHTWTTIEAAMPKQLSNRKPVSSISNLQRRSANQAKKHDGLPGLLERKDYFMFNYEKAVNKYYDADFRCELAHMYKTVVQTSRNDHDIRRIDFYMMKGDHTTAMMQITNPYDTLGRYYPNHDYDLPPCHQLFHDEQPLYEATFRLGVDFETAMCNRLGCSFMESSELHDIAYPLNPSDPTVAEGKIKILGFIDEALRTKSGVSAASSRQDSSSYGGRQIRGRTSPAMVPDEYEGEHQSSTASSLLDSSRGTPATAVEAQSSSLLDSSRGTPATAVEAQSSSLLDSSRGTPAIPPAPNQSSSVSYVGLISSDPSVRYKGWLPPDMIYEDVSINFLRSTFTDARLRAEIALQNNLDVPISTVIDFKFHTLLSLWIGWCVEEDKCGALDVPDPDGKLLEQSLQSLEVLALQQDPNINGLAAGSWPQQLFQGTLSTRGTIFWTIFQHFLCIKKTVIVNILHAIKYYSPWELGEHEQDSLVIEINKICRDCGISLESNPTADLDKADEETIYQSLLNRLQYLIEESWGGERNNSVYLLNNLRQIRWSSYNSTGMLLPADRTEPPFARYKDSNCPPTVAQLCYFLGRHAFNAYRFNNDITYRSLARNLTSYGHPFDLRSHGPNLNQVSSGHAAREIHSTISPAGPVRSHDVDASVSESPQPTKPPNPNGSPGPSSHGHVQKGPTSNSKRKDIGPSQGPEQKLSRVLCPRCGHNCFIAKAEHCRFHTHPDVNAFGTVSWEGSKAQQAWAAVMDPTGQPYRSIQRGHTAFQVHGVKIPLVRVDNFDLTT